MADVIIFQRFWQRRDTSANWTSVNPTLASGEFGYETDTKRLKIGDGTTPWTSLGYLPTDAETTSYEGNSAAGLSATNVQDAIDQLAASISGGGASITLTASEDIDSGQIVNIWSDGGTPKARLAKASVTGFRAHGYAIADTPSGSSISVFTSGLNTSLSGLTVGSTLFLSTTPGGVTTDVSGFGDGDVVQELGTAYSTASMIFDPHPPIEIVTA